MGRAEPALRKTKFLGSFSGGQKHSKIIIETMIHTRDALALTLVSVSCNKTSTSNGSFCPVAFCLSTDWVEVNFDSRRRSLPQLILFGEPPLRHHSTKKETQQLLVIATSSLKETFVDSTTCGCAP